MPSPPIHTHKSGLEVVSEAHPAPPLPIKSEGVKTRYLSTAIILAFPLSFFIQSRKHLFHNRDIYPSVRVDIIAVQCGGLVPFELFYAKLFCILSSDNDMLLSTTEQYSKTLFAPGLLSILPYIVSFLAGLHQAFPNFLATVVHLSCNCHFVNVAMVVKTVWRVIRGCKAAYTNRAFQLSYGKASSCSVMP